MPDPRLTKLADLLVQYSVKVKPEDFVAIYYHPLAEELAAEVYRAVLQAGGLPHAGVDSDRIAEAKYRFASDKQLDWISPVDQLLYNDADVGIVLTASENTRFLTNVDPQKQQRVAAAGAGLMKVLMERTASGEFRWTMTQYPCQAYAQDAEMSLSEYQDFVHSATFTDQDDPVAAWQQVHDEQQKIVDWLKGKKRVTVQSPHAELSLSIEGRGFINADGTFNMPSGEVYTSPVEDSAEGWVEFTYPAIELGREVTGIRFEIEKGRVIRATAEKNEEFLNALLDTDEGARVLGEFAIGTNYGIRKFTGSILYDEKIGGSFHIATGLGFPEIGGKNVSGTHWDFISDIKEDSEIHVDGELLYKNGEFVI